MKIGDLQLASSDVQINGVSLRVLQAGEGEPVVCLHGFPDTPHTFEHQLSVLVDKGYRVVVPFLRGYPPSETGSKLDYFARTLSEDLLGVIDEVCDGSAIVFGHDWGVIAAFGAAHLAPEKISRLIVAAVPPFSSFAALKFNPRQIWRSRYALFFQLGSIANYVMRRNNLAGINYLWDYWSPTWRYSQKDIQPVKDSLSQPGGMEAATAYYRAIVWGSIKQKDWIELLSQPVSQPTLVCVGDNDGCMDPRYFDHLDEAFSGKWELVRIPGAGHFLHRENPQDFNSALLAFLQNT